MVFELVTKITTNVLTALYEPFGFSILLSILFMFSYLYVKEHGLKFSIKKWIHQFKGDSKFRITFFLAFYIALVLFRTLLNRNLWMNPLSNIMDGWGLYAANGEFTTESIENVILFIPFMPLLLYSKIFDFSKDLMKFSNIMYISCKCSFLFSICIELAQLILRLGTFQFADIVYNGLGGVIGGAIYYIIRKKRG